MTEDAPALTDLAPFDAAAHAGARHALRNFAKMVPTYDVDLSGIVAAANQVRSIVATVVQSIDLSGFLTSWQHALEALEQSFRDGLPPNLLNAEDLSFGALIDLADEGITLWSVPRAAVAARFMRATSPQARRRVLGDASVEILEDCAEVAATATSGPFPDLARLQGQAIRAVQDGHIAAGQALTASVLDTLLQVAFGKRDRVRLTWHPRGTATGVPMDHYDELTVAAAMVLRPIWFAYRPQDTAEDRAASPAFARHATAHHIHGRQVSRRNAVQALMLTTALLSYLAVLDANATSGT